MDTGYAVSLFVQREFVVRTPNDIIEPSHSCPRASVFSLATIDAGTPSHLTARNLVLHESTLRAGSKDIAWEHGTLGDYRSGSRSGISSETSSGTSSGTSSETSSETSSGMGILSIPTRTQATDNHKCLVSPLVEGINIRWMPFISLFARLYEAHLLMG